MVFEDLDEPCMMPTRDNMSLTLLAKPVFCHEGNLIACEKQKGYLVVSY